VGIYVGDRSFTHSSAGLGVSFASLDDTYWKPRFLGARRPQR
jgi:cell wall-associated NlpC family hydrolase